MESEDDDSMIQNLCAAHNDEEERKLDAQNIAICHLTLKALSFKHGIKLGASGAHPHTVHTAADGLVLYMRCMLVNIFMKRIMGENCVKTAGGKRAFEAAKAFVDTPGTAARNSTCEKADMAPGGDRTQNPHNWTLLDIMGRWLERNRGTLNDGKEGVLGDSCSVNISARMDADKAKVLDELKKKVEVEMDKVGQHMKENITTILNAVKTCTDMKCVKRVIQQEMEKEQQEKNGASPRETPEFRATATDPGTGGDGKARSENPGATKPAPAKPAPAKPVAAKPGGPVTPVATGS
ncbi:hypothetical protein AK88_04617 [Plasmodium fragile]|uniref:Uncharacterized protein n=1 Tax=Plasmodium fragile TaxID=5857 RepID=A0A0D9QG13_PLAFR|nr:uncharacterized protein AK88_04617 [Plasmodium fragile]KJP85747.1 hypothetical protein AK88_04617 [Plasmodium fragile]